MIELAYGAEMALAQVAPEATSGAAEFWVFWLIAPLSLAAAISVVVLKNPVHAALMLVVNFFTFAIFYAVLQGQFLATIQVIVYAGAIMILFLFVLMLLGVDRAAEQGPGRLKGQKVAAITLGLVLFVGLTGAVAGPYMGIDSACNTSAAVDEAITDAGGSARPCGGLEGRNAEPGGNVAGIGRLIFTDYVWPFEVTSVLLVVAAIGAMVLGKRTDVLSDLVDQGEADPPARPQPKVLTPSGAPSEAPRSGSVALDKAASPAGLDAAGASAEEVSDDEVDVEGVEDADVLEMDDRPDSTADTPTSDDDADTPASDDDADTPASDDDDGEDDQ